MNKQLHKRFSSDFICSIFKKYKAGSLSLKQALYYLDVKRRRFFYLFKSYKENPEAFSIEYKRRSPKRISSKLEKIIIRELQKEKALVTNKDIPVYGYNYTYLRDQIFKKHKIKVSVPTIINRAKKNDCYIVKKEKKKHDREVLTDYPGELIQHDSSHHKFSPMADHKWYLITSIDDYSRYLLYAKLLERETSWAHISALESVILKHGIPLRYYVDSHSIFRFVRGRDSLWQHHLKVTDQVVPQWKQVLLDLDVKVTYALSPQAKGKAERPYGWLQDRLVRTCARENITGIREAQKVLSYEVNRYNYHQVHSTTGEKPFYRFRQAISNNKTMFREFKIPEPYQTTKDIFCLRTEKPVDAYHKIRINNYITKVKGVPLRDKVEIRMVPSQKRGISELRFWYRNKLVDVKRATNTDLGIVQF